MPNGLPKHVCFRHDADDLNHAKGPLSFQEYDLEFTYMPGVYSSDELLCQITMPLSNESKPKSDDTCPLSEEISNKLSYEVAVQLSDEEQKEMMDTSEPPATLYQTPKHGHTIKLLDEKLTWIITEALLYLIHGN